MFRELRTHLQRLGAKRDSGLRSSDSDATAKLLKFYTRVAKRVLDAERCSIFIVDPENRTVWLKAGTQLTEHDIEVPTEGSVVGQVIESGQIVRGTDMQHQEGAHRATDSQTGFVTRNMLCVPVSEPGLGETVGAIQVLNKAGNGDFSSADEAFLTEMAEHVQTHVTLCYLDQDIFGLSEKVMRTARKTVRMLLAAAGILLLALVGVLFIWLLVPLFD